MTERRDKGAGGRSPWDKGLSRARKTSAPAESPSPGEGSLPAEGSSPVETPSPPQDVPRRRDPLHGVTLKMVVTRLEARYGWEELGRRIPINCFLHEPSIASSLKFLRRTPWAREKVEGLYRQTPALHGQSGE